MFFNKKGEEIQELLEVNSVAQKDVIPLANRVLVAFIVKYIFIAYSFYESFNMISAGIQSDATISIKITSKVVIELNKALPGVTISIVVLLLAIFVNFKVKIKK